MLSIRRGGCYVADAPELTPQTFCRQLAASAVTQLLYLW